MLRFRMMLGVGVFGCGFMAAAMSQVPPARPPHAEPAGHIEEHAQQVRERRERMRALREEMLRELRQPEAGMPVADSLRGEVPPSLPDPPRARGRDFSPNYGAGAGNNWGPVRERTQPPMRPTRGEWRRQPPPPDGASAPAANNRLSPEERRQFRRQMREAAREVYGE